MSPAPAINFLPEAFEATLQPCLILRSARSALRRSGCTAKRTTGSQHTFSRLLQKLATQGVEIAFSGQSNILCERAFPANGLSIHWTFPFSPNPTGIPYRYSTLGWGALNKGRIHGTKLLDGILKANHGCLSGIETNDQCIALCGSYQNEGIELGP